MSGEKISRDEKALATRGALVSAARRLFAEKGYHSTGTHEVVAVAGVTRGALRHHFARKEDLFLAVFGEVQKDLLARAESMVLDKHGADHWQGFRASLSAFLDAATQPEVQRILLLDGPAVLGSAQWRQLEVHYGLGAIQASVEKMMREGFIRAQPSGPLASLILALVDEAALLVATASDAEKARAEVEGALDTLLANLNP